MRNTRHPRIQRQCCDGLCCSGHACPQVRHLQHRLSGRAPWHRAFAPGTVTRHRMPLGQRLRRLWRELLDWLGGPTP